MDILFTLQELAILVTLVSELTPENYTSPEAKSVIFKCKAAVADPKNGIGFAFGG